MKNLSFAILGSILISDCFVETSPPEPQPNPPYYLPYPGNQPGWVSTTEEDYYCGDGYCDDWMGENDWNCVDCGYDPYTGGPYDGGYCGDGFCYGYETPMTCWRDCGVF